MLSKFYRAPDFVEFVLGSFSCFYIEFAYSKFTFCDTYALNFLERHTILGKRTHHLKFLAAVTMPYKKDFVSAKKLLELLSIALLFTVFEFRKKVQYIY